MFLLSNWLCVLLFSLYILMLGGIQLNNFVINVTIQILCVCRTRKFLLYTFLYLTIRKSFSVWNLTWSFLQASQAPQLARRPWYPRNRTNSRRGWRDYDKRSSHCCTDIICYVLLSYVRF